MQGDMDIVDPLIEEYLTRLSPSPDPVETEMRRFADERGGFPIIGPLVGQLLSHYAQAIGARRVFELGSGFGYSAFWLARAVGPDGHVVLTETDPEHVRRARDFLAQAALLDRCRIENSDALSHLEKAGEQDLIFVDIEKADYPKAFALALPRLRKGGLLIADNVLWGGAVVRGERDAATEGIREYMRLIHAAPNLLSVVIPIRDGVAVSLRIG